MSLKSGVEIVKRDFKNYALFTNASAIDSNFKSSVDILKPKFILTGEHGLYFEFDRGEKFLHYQDYFRDLQVYPIYPEIEEVFDYIEGIVVDIQDVGARPFTFVYGLYNLIEIAKKKNYKIIILDRPNPILKSFGYVSDKHHILSPYGVPFLYPFTFGELGLYFGDIIGLKVKVVPFQFDDTLKSCEMYFSSVSLNLTSSQSVYLFPALVLLEGLKDISVGRGTGKPFRVVGTRKNYTKQLLDYLQALNFKGIFFREIAFKPRYDVLKDELLFGIEFFVKDINTLDVMKLGFYLFKFFAERSFEFSLDEGGIPFIEKIYEGLKDHLDDLESFYLREYARGLEFISKVYNNYRICTRRCV